MSSPATSGGCPTLVVEGQIKFSLVLMDSESWDGCCNLSPFLYKKISLFVQAAIRKELNEFKSCEMEVHEESKQFTR